VRGALLHFSVMPGHLLSLSFGVTHLTTSHPFGYPERVVRKPQMGLDQFGP